MRISIENLTLCVKVTSAAFESAPADLIRI
jgi:hypothetical protein